MMTVFLTNGNVPYDFSAVGTETLNLKPDMKHHHANRFREFNICLTVYTFAGNDGAGR